LGLLSEFPIVAQLEKIAHSGHPGSIRNNEAAILIFTYLCLY